MTATIAALIWRPSPLRAGHTGPEARTPRSLTHGSLQESAILTQDRS